MTLYMTMRRLNSKSAFADFLSQIFRHPVCQICMPNQNICHVQRSRFLTADFAICCRFCKICVQVCVCRFCFNRVFSQTLRLADVELFNQALSMQEKSARLHLRADFFKKPSFPKPLLLFGTKAGSPDWSDLQRANHGEPAFYHKKSKI